MHEDDRPVLFNKVAARLYQKVVGTFSSDQKAKTGAMFVMGDVDIIVFVGPDSCPPTAFEVVRHFDVIPQVDADCGYLMHKWSILSAFLEIPFVCEA